jgi:multiple antibiotic resistance protein
VDVPAAVVTLFLIMDPIGNIPLFLSVLKPVDPARRRRVLIREIALAYVVLLVFVFLGSYLLRFLGLDEGTISIAGGIVLFLIALRMIFPAGSGPTATDAPEGEPFIVPLAIPLFVGPSTLAALLLLQRTSPGQTGPLLLAVTMAWALSGAILLSSTFFYRVLRERGLMALERLMGMLLVMIAVQMFMSGVRTFLVR